MVSSPLLFRLSAPSHVVVRIQEACFMLWNLSEEHPEFRTKKQHKKSLFILEAKSPVKQKRLAL